jgi:tetratricopeptide (TPR) repeat protein
MSRLLPAWFGILVSVAAAQQPQEALALNDRGLAAEDRGEYIEAERLFRQSLEIWRSLGAGFQAHSATVLINLADSLCSQGRWREGEQVLQEGLVLNRRTLGPKSIRTLTNMNLLGSVFFTLDEPERAAALYNEALPLERANFPGDIQLARTLLGLASLRLAEGKTGDAVALADEGLEITLKAKGENDPETALAYAKLAGIHRGGGHLERALPLFRKARVIYEQTLGPTNPMTASLWSQEGLALLADGKPTLAADELKRAVAVLSRCSGCDFAVSAAQRNLAILRLRQKKYREADTLLSEALARQEKSSSRPGPEMVSTLQVLSEVREKENRHEDAAKLRDRAATILSYR